MVLSPSAARTMRLAMPRTVLLLPPRAGLKTRAYALFFVLIVVGSAGCGVIGGSSPTATPTLTSTPTMTRTPTPTLTPTSTPTQTPVPIVQTNLVEVAQGRSAVLRVAGVAASATASYKGKTIGLLPAPGGFWGVIGAPADAAIGQFPIAIVLRDTNGGVISEMSETLAVYDADFPIEYITLPPDQSGLLGPDVGAQEEALRQQMFATSSPERLWAGAFVHPVQGAAINSPYGQQRSYNGGPVSGFHHGADFGVDEGTAVYASATGRVAFVGAMPIRGNSVVIDHGAGVFTGYHHLSSAAVQQGQSVSQGGLIGYSGMSGLATGPHLHWEVVVHGISVDPVFWTYDEIGP